MPTDVIHQLTDRQKTKRLEAIASTIRKTHGEFLALAGRSLALAKEIGELLIEAKVIVDHGRWTDWLQGSFPGSPTTAEAYMRIAKKWDVIESKTTETADLTLDAALKLLAKPKPEPVPAEPVESGPDTCRNCGGSDFDEDGDCTQCREPSADTPPDAEESPESDGDGEEDSRDQEDAPDAADASTPHKEPFGEQLRLVILRFWQNQYPEVPSIAVADWLGDIAEEIKSGKLHEEN